VSQKRPPDKGPSHLRAILNFTPGPQGWTLYCLEEWRGEQRTSPPGDNFIPRGQSSPVGDNFASGVKVCPRGEVKNGPRWTGIYAVKNMSAHFGLKSWLLFQGNVIILFGRLTRVSSLEAIFGLIWNSTNRRRQEDLGEILLATGINENVTKFLAIGAAYLGLWIFVNMPQCFTWTPKPKQDPKPYVGTYIGLFQWKKLLQNTVLI
jgi:hypothetical protein